LQIAADDILAVRRNWAIMGLRPGGIDMDHNETRPPRHYRDRMAETGHSMHRPKICLSAIKAARHYQEVLAAAEAARVELVEMTVQRAPDRRAALAALNHLAESFRLPDFSFSEVTAVDPPQA
jgi:hypothetical protein